MHIQANRQRSRWLLSFFVPPQFVAGVFHAGGSNICADNTGLPFVTDDMATAMTKMLTVGMPLAAVIKAATTTPAETIGWNDRIGSLQPGFAADIAVLEMQEIAADAPPLLFEDCQAQLRPVTRRLVGRCVWKAGKEHAVTCPEDDDSHRFGFPSKRSIAMGRPAWDTLVVRDTTPPPPVEPEFEAVVTAALAALKERADEALLRGSVGDGNPNTPIGLSLLPFCIMAPPLPSSSIGVEASARMLAIEDRKTEQDSSSVETVTVHHRQRRRMLISFPESEAYLEKLRREVRLY